jgi:methyl-accepting chemotaxis protein
MRSHAVSEAVRLAIITGGLSILLALAIVALMRNRVTGPLNGIARAMGDMAAGNLDREVPHTDLTDEVGAINNALVEIKRSVAERAAASAETEMAAQRRIVSALGNGLSALKAGRLTHVIHEDFPGEYRVLREDFNAALLALRDIIGDVNQASDSVRTGAHEISSAANDLARRTGRRLPRSKKPQERSAA